MSVNTIYKLKRQGVWHAVLHLTSGRMNSREELEEQRHQDLSENTFYYSC